VSPLRSSALVPVTFAAVDDTSTNVVSSI
jgi:hypothetical protein